MCQSGRNFFFHFLVSFKKFSFLRISSIFARSCVDSLERGASGVLVNCSLWVASLDLAPSLLG